MAAWPIAFLPWNRRIAHCLPEFSVRAGRGCSLRAVGRPPRPKRPAEGRPALSMNRHRIHHEAHEDHEGQPRLLLRGLRALRGDGSGSWFRWVPARPKDLSLRQGVRCPPFRVSECQSTLKRGHQTGRPGSTLRCAVRASWRLRQRVSQLRDGPKSYTRGIADRQDVLKRV
jgi:hypothetical protein